MNSMSEIRRPVRQDIRRPEIGQIERPVYSPKKKNKLLARVFLIIVIIIILFIIAYLVFGLGKVKSKSEWQAVFLSDGQIYFGKVVGQSAKDVILENIFYLQNPGSLQQGENNLNKQGGEVGLIKLGNEIHGPYDEMRINRQHILFIEDLKPESKIIKAIQNYSR